MEVRKNTLWRVVVYVPVASVVYALVTMWLSPLYWHKVTGPDGVVTMMTNTAVQTILDVVLLLVIFVVGCLLLRSMTRREIAASALILALIEIVLIVLGRAAPGLTSLLLSWPILLAREMFSTIAFYIHQLLPSSLLSSLLAAFAPLLFVPVGRRDQEAA